LAQLRRWDLIVRINPIDASAWQEWASNETDPDLALDRYAHAAAIASENPYYHESLGMALEASHRYENYSQALKEYLKVLQLSPSRAYDALAVGRILYILGEPSQACAWFKNALRIEPHYWECDLWIARCLHRLGKPGRAVAVSEQLKKRREFYLMWRKRVYDDLPVPNEPPSPYEKVLLSYDDAVVDRELKAVQGHR
jgi:tetratricopeptide (TPR) repeat protein